MSQKIYVGNMNYATTEAALTNLFSQYGEVVSSTIIKDRYTQQSKGFGFIEMADAQAAEAAIATLNNQELRGAVFFALDRRAGLLSPARRRSLTPPVSHATLSA